MSSTNPIRNLLLGKNKIQSRTEYKYALLLGELSLLLGAIGFVYTLIDVSNGVYMYIPWYLAGVAIAIFIIYQNKIGNYLVSAIILLVTSNLMIYMFAAVNNPQGGVYFYFIAVSVISLVILNPVGRRLGYIFVAASISLAGIAYFGEDWSLIPAPEYDLSYLKIRFATNFLIGLISCALVILFVMKRNKDSENALIENHKKLEVLTKELEKSKNRFSMAAEGSKAGIYEWEIQTNKVYVSRRWLSLLGYSDKDNVNVDVEFFLSITHPDDHARTSANIQNAIEKGVPYQNELRMKGKDGNYRWFLDSGMARKIDGVPDLAVGSISDIHEKKLDKEQLLTKNEELEKTNEELDRFVYSASHDMRAPLSTLLGLLQLTKMTEDPKELSNYFDLMTERIYTMEGFIKEVTDYSRNARLELEKAKVNLREIIEGVITSFEILAKEAKVEIQMEVAPVLFVTTDAGRLNVVLSNLLANAVKYHDPSKPKRQVQILADVKGSTFQIEIIDNGIGIKDEFKNKIFDMFFRASENSNGSGLGLYIVKETIQKLDGSIQSESKPGEGSTFKVSIPFDT